MSAPHLPPSHELPADLHGVHRRAQRLQWLTLLFLAVAVTALYFVLGSSQAMRTAWFEDMLGVIPVLVFLIGDRYRTRQPNDVYPYGMHRLPSLGHLAAAVALLGMGTFLLIDSILKLVHQEHPTIGTVVVLGHQVWLGWLMMLVMFGTVIPAVLLGRAKIACAQRLHNKLLHADADMLKADWMTAMATIVGVAGIGIGWWWADATAAAVISLSIVRDGYRNARTAVFALADKVPMNVTGTHVDRIVGQLQAELEKRPRVRHARVRLREYGQVLMGEAFLEPEGEPFTELELERMSVDITQRHWRIQQLLVLPGGRTGRELDDAR